VVAPDHPEGSADRALLAIAAHADESEAHVREVDRFSQNLPKGSYLTCDTFGSRDGGRLADLRILVPGRADVLTNLGCRAARSSPGGWAVGPMAYRGARDVLGLGCASNAARSPEPPGMS
jgi:hypothetical protein